VEACNQENTMWGKLIAAAVTSGLAKKAWDHYRAPRHRLPEDITNLVGRPEAAQPQRKRQSAKPSRRRPDGPSA
jgi:hypothetical protein